MTPDSNPLITVQAAFEQDASGLATISLLRPFLSGHRLAQGWVSHLRLLSGNEAGVSLSEDGNRLLIEPSHYRYLLPEATERLCYEYRINLVGGGDSRHTVMVSLAADERSQGAVIQEVLLTTDTPFDSGEQDSPSALHGDEGVGAGASDREVTDNMVQTQSDEPPVTKDGSEPDGSPLAASCLSGSEQASGFSFRAPAESDGEPRLEPNEVEESASALLTYEDLAPQAPEVEQAQPEAAPEVDRSKDIERVLAEAGQLLEATLGVLSSGAEPEQVAEENSAEEEAVLTDIINGLSVITDQLGVPRLESQLAESQEPEPLPLIYDAVIQKQGCYIFNLSDFDKQPGSRVGTLDNIIIETLPQAGQLLYNREPVAEGQGISQVDLLTGRLLFKPDVDFTDRGEAHFFFSLEGRDVAFPRYRQLFQLSYYEHSAIKALQAKASKADTAKKPEQKPEQKFEQEFEQKSGKEPAEAAHLAPDGGRLEGVITVAAAIDNKAFTMLRGHLAPAEAVAFIAGTFTGRYGELRLDSQGSWTYSVSKKQPAIAGIREYGCLLEPVAVPLGNGESLCITLVIARRHQQLTLFVSDELHRVL